MILTIVALGVIFLQGHLEKIRNQYYQWFFIAFSDALGWEARFLCKKKHTSGSYANFCAESDSESDSETKVRSSSHV